jgi:hypothetical protein
MYAIKARRNIATLQRARPDIISRTGVAQRTKGFRGMRTPDERAKLAAEEPDAHGVEWLQAGARPMLFRRSLAHLKREISEEKWAGGQISNKKYRMPLEQQPGRTVAGSTKRLASRLYLLKTGLCLAEQYLNWMKSRATAQCGWCGYKTQTREHV